MLELNDNGMERMILRFQLDAAQQSIIDMEKELDSQKLLNTKLQQTVKEKDKELKQVKGSMPSSSQQQQLLQQQQQHMQKLEKKVEELESKLVQLEGVTKGLHDSLLCRLCLTRQRNVLLLPCMHLLYCRDCLESHDEKVPISSCLAFTHKFAPPQQRTRPDYAHPVQF